MNELMWIKPSAQWDHSEHHLHFPLLPPPRGGARPPAHGASEETLPSRGRPPQLRIPVIS